MRIRDLLQEHIKKDVNRNFLSYKDRNVSYGDLYVSVNNNVYNFFEQGIQAGDTVILEYTDKIAWVISIVTLLMMKCKVVLLPENMPKHQQEIILGKVTHAKKIEAEKFCYEMTPICTKDYWSLCENTPFIPDIVGIYQCSSGSTGEPKLVLRSEEAFIYEGISFQKTFQLSVEDKLLSIAPLTHSFAFGATLMATIVTGCTLYLIDDFQPRTTLSLIEKNQITMLVLVPIMTRVLAEIGLRKKYNLSSLRIPLVGAGKVDETLNQMFFDAYGINLMLNYGSTETGGLISNLSCSNYRSIGKAMWGDEFQIRDGELWVKTPAIMEGYYGEKVSLDQNGFYCMNDLCRKDEDGYFYILGRKQNIIKVGGNTVNPNEVEAVLNEIDQIDECVVVGSRNKRGEEQVNALIRASKSISEAEIRRYSLERLEDYKCPKVIKFCDSIPRNSIGKIDVKKIREQYGFE